MYDLVITWSKSSLAYFTDCCRLGCGFLGYMQCTTIFRNSNGFQSNAPREECHVMLMRTSLGPLLKQREYSEDAVLHVLAIPFMSAPGPGIESNPSLLKHRGGSCTRSHSAFSRDRFWMHYNPLGLELVLYMAICSVYITLALSLSRFQTPSDTTRPPSKHAHPHVQNTTPSVGTEAQACLMFACTVQSTINVCHTRALLAEDQAMERCSCRRIQILPVAGMFIQTGDSSWSSI